jgi:hypothetical protein
MLSGTSEKECIVKPASPKRKSGDASAMKKYTGDISPDWGRKILNAPVSPRHSVGCKNHQVKNGVV